jgi:uncharacterized protein
MFVSYQGQGSLGRRIQNGQKEFIVQGSGGKTETYEVKLEIKTMDAFTGHSDRLQLMKFIQSCNPRPKKVIINHGESSRCLDLASSIHKGFRIETNCPRNLDSIRIK